jgi:hypothetical protein
MEILILDLTGVDPNTPGVWDDAPALAKLKAALLDHAGRGVRVRIAEVASPRGCKNSLHTDAMKDRDAVS